MSDSAHERGAALLQEGRYAEAAQALREAVAINEADENAWRYLGAALGSIGDISGSVEAFGRTVALNPASAKNRYNLALAQERNGDSASARSNLEKALVLDPGYTQAQEALTRLAGTAVPPALPTTIPTDTSSPSWQSEGENHYQPPAAPVSAGRTFLSILLAFLAGAIGIALWVTIIAVTKINLALIGIGVGFLIGIAAAKGYGREGKTPAVIAVTMAALFIGGFNLLDLVVTLLGKSSGLGRVWGVIFDVLCTVWGIQQAYKTASSPVESDD